MIKRYTALSGTRLQGRMRGFFGFLFALHLVYILEARKHPGLGVRHVSTRVMRGQGQITDLLVHTQILVTPVQKVLSEKMKDRKGTVPSPPPKINPKSNHLEKKFQIHSKVLKTRGDFGLAFGQVQCLFATQGLTTQFCSSLGFHHRNL